MSAFDPMWAEIRERQDAELIARDRLWRAQSESVRLREDLIRLIKHWEYEIGNGHGANRSGLIRAVDQVRELLDQDEGTQ